MTTIAKLVAQSVRANSLEANTLRQLGLLCCASLFVYVLTLTYGLDLSSGLF